MNIESIKRRLLVKYPYFGSVVANSNFIAEPAIGTAGTDGKIIYYNPNFIESITDDQQTFVFAHEICHIAFDHILRSEGKDKDLWNEAADSVINALLKRDGLPILEGSIDNPEAINYDVEEMYKKLLEEKKQHKNQQNQNEQGQGQSNDSGQQENQQSQDRQGSSNSPDEVADNQNEQGQGQSNDSGQQENQQSQDSQGSSNSRDEVADNQNEQGQGQSNDPSQQESQQNQDSQGSSNSPDEVADNQNEQSEAKEKQNKNNNVGHATHSLWDKAIEEKHQEEKSDKTIEEKENKKNEEVKKITELGEKETFKQNKIERSKLLEELRKVLVSQSHGHGNAVNCEKRNVTNIGASVPLIDWRRLLKEAIKYDVDWSYQNAGVEDGVVTAYLEEMPKSETEIILDTSLSIDETLLRNFLRECKNILQTSKVKVGCFDTLFYGFTEIKDISDIDNLEFYGGGGTDFDVAVNAFTRRVENKIIFTDGIADMPTTPIDAIWIVFGGAKINPAGGKVIYINDKQFESLCNQMTNGTKGR